VVRAEAETGGAELLVDRGQARQQRQLAVHDDAGMATQHLCLPARQVELAAPDIDPHVGVGNHQIGIAREPEASDVEQGGEPLVGDGDVDVFEVDDVAEIFGGAIIGLLHGGGRSEMRCAFRSDYSIRQSGASAMNEGRGRSNSALPWGLTIPMLVCKHDCKSNNNRARSAHNMRGRLSWHCNRSSPSWRNSASRAW